MVYRTEFEIPPIATPEKFTPVPTPRRTRSRSQISRLTDDDRTSRGAESLVSDAHDHHHQRNVLDLHKNGLVNKLIERNHNCNQSLSFQICRDQERSSSTSTSPTASQALHKILGPRPAVQHYASFIPQGCLTPAPPDSELLDNCAIAATEN